MESAETAPLRTERFSFPSADGTSTIQARIMWPEGDPKAIFQIVHGMAEHVGRYEDFARHMARAGYAVCAHDQIAHGESAEDGRYGKLPLHGADRFLVDDIHHVQTEMQKRCGGLPAAIFGHSLGSYLTRAYLACYGDRHIQAAVLCGTGHVPPALSAFGNALARRLARLKGEDAYSALLHGMADGSYSKAVKDARTDFDWLSRDERNVDDYIADPACGFPFSIGGYGAVTALTRFVCSPDCFERWPKDVPVLFVAGTEDPVGSCGEGVEKAAQMARDAGVEDVTVTLYPEMRHEILNEAGKERVFEDVLVWCDEKLGF